MSRIFLAGAAGVIGRRLTPLLLAHGHAVWGATRSPDKGEVLRKLGARPVVVDVFDAEALAAAVLEAKPEIVIHQLTDLVRGSRSGEAIRRARPQRAHPRRRNAQLRRRGAKRWRAASDRAEHRLGLCARRSALSRRPSVGHGCGGRSGRERARRRVARATGPRRVAHGRLGAALRQALRPRQRSGYAPGPPSVHVDAAAYAALLAIDHGKPGVFNIADPNGEVSTDKAIAELGWRADFRRSSLSD